MKVLAIIKSNLLQLGFQSLSGAAPMCCAPRHSLNISQCYQMVKCNNAGVGSSIVEQHRQVVSIKNHNNKPLKNKRINQRQRVRFNLDEKKSNESSSTTTSLLLVKDSPCGTTSSSFQKNKHKSRKSSASIVFVSIYFRKIQKI